MKASSIVSEMQTQGFALSLTSTGGLAVTPASKLQPHDRDLIRSNKAAIVDYLTAANDPAPDPDTQAEPKRLFRPRGPWLSPSEQLAADTYHLHHAQCRQCQSGGRGYSSRCSTGAELWARYQGAD